MGVFLDFMALGYLDLSLFPHAKFRHKRTRCPCQGFWPGRAAFLRVRKTEEANNRVIPHVNALPLDKNNRGR